MCVCLFVCLFVCCFCFVCFCCVWGFFGTGGSVNCQVFFCFVIVVDCLFVCLLIGWSVGWLFGCCLFVCLFGLGFFFLLLSEN